MKRLLLLVVMAGVVLMLALEMGVRGGGRTTLLEPSDAFAADRRGWCGGAWLETDARGERRDPGERPATPSGGGPTRRIHVIGGAFTAGAGLEAGELYPARLETRARDGGWRDVAAIAMATPARKVEEALRLVASGSLGAQDVVVLEVDSSDLGADPKWFGIERPASRTLAPVEPSASAALTWLRLIALRRERERYEDEIAELVARDGFTGRASAQSKLELEALTSALAQRRPEPRQVERLRAWIAELDGLTRMEERQERLAEWRGLFETLQRAHVLAIVVVTGPTLPTLGLAEEARGAGVPVLHAPPFELDPELRIDAPFPRPAAAVHAQVADSLCVELTRRGLLAGAAAAPEAMLAAADAIEQQFMSRGGFDEATITLARGVIAPSIHFADGALPANVLRGLAAGGRLEPGVSAEIVLRRPSLPGDLIVRAEAPADVAPRLALRHRADRATAVPRLLGPSTRDGGASHGAPGSRVLLEWRFEPPPARGGNDYPCLELGLLPSADGAPPKPVDLRELRFEARPSDPQER